MSLGFLASKKEFTTTFNTTSSTSSSFTTTYSTSKSTTTTYNTSSTTNYNTSSTTTYNTTGSTQYEQWTNQSSYWVTYGGGLYHLGSQGVWQGNTGGVIFTGQANNITTYNTGGATYYRGNFAYTGVCCGGQYWYYNMNRYGGTTSTSHTTTVGTSHTTTFSTSKSTTTTFNTSKSTTTTFNTTGSTSRTTSFYA